jgi:hypothetical protein
LGISFFAKESTRWGKSVQEALGGSKEASQEFSYTVGKILNR